MSDEKLRQGIIVEAARMMSSRAETDYYRAKLKAARRLRHGWVKPSDLPTDEEIRDEILRMATLFAGNFRVDRLREMPVEALLRPELRDTDLEDDLAADEAAIERLQVYRSLLIPLESVMQDEHFHPEGDVLYHLLQCYVLARDELPYDEEFQLAALLHDVGKGIDKHHHVEAGLEALEGQITPRTKWLIEHHMEVHKIRDRSIGHRAFLRLRESPDYEDLLRLGACDRKGRVCGAVVPEVDEALNQLRELARLYGS
jgi:hypothetical protein